MIDIQLADLRGMLQGAATLIGVSVICVGIGVVTGAIVDKTPGITNKSLIVSSVVFAITTLVLYTIFWPR